MSVFSEKTIELFNQRWVSQMPSVCSRASRLVRGKEKNKCLGKHRSGGAVFSLYWKSDEEVVPFVGQGLTVTEKR